MADVAVIGGGVIGLASAWRLAQRGLSVIVLERDVLGAGASSVAAGMLGPVSEAEFGASGERSLALGLDGVGRWPAFARELEQASGLEVGLREEGTLMVARDADEAEALERELHFRVSLGLPATRLRASDARAVEPALAPRLRLALDVPGDHSVDPRRVLRALRAACEGAGVQLRERVGVARPEVESGRVRGVALGAGEDVRCEWAVVATGSWTTELPVRPVKGQTVRLRDPSGPGLLTRVLRYAGGYLVPRQDGRYVLGATMEERGFDTTSTAGATYELLRDVQELVPGVSEMVIEELAVGLRPSTPDNLPAIGPAPAVGGLMWAVGHHRNGILLTPLTADSVGALVCGDPVAEVVRACAPERLAGARA